MRKIFFIALFVVALFAGDYEDWLASQNKEYTTYKKTMDDEFADMLKKDWQDYKAFVNQSQYTKPKPTAKKIPKITKPKVLPKKIIQTSKPVVIPKVIKKPQPKKVAPVVVAKEIVKQEIKKKKIKVSNLKGIKFKFFGEDITIFIDKKQSLKPFKFSKDGLRNFWKMMAKTKYKPLLKQIVAYQKSLNLNGWGLYKLVHRLGKEIYLNNGNANMFAWFILSKMGYDVKVGYTKSTVYLLSTMAHKLYQVAFFKIDNKRYYVLTPNGRIKKVGQMFTYNGNYPKANKKLSFVMKKPILFDSSISTKELKFYYREDKKYYTVYGKYNQELVDFYKTFPQSDYKVYFEDEVSQQTSYSLLNGLKPFIQDKSELEAVNFLLRFVQKSFRYRTDQMQFGYEKPLFLEETLKYPYSDCEDRSIFFAYLVKKLTNLDVVGVKYSDHMATAVAFSSDTVGAKFRYNGKVYTITDPTYINANVGQAMPKYKNKSFEIVKINR